MVPLLRLLESGTSWPETLRPSRVTSANEGDGVCWICPFASPPSFFRLFKLHICMRISGEFILYLFRATGGAIALRFSLCALHIAFPRCA